VTKKEIKKEYDLKAAKQLFNEYQSKRKQVKKINLPPDTVEVDDLNRTETLNRLYEIVDNLIEMIYANGRPSLAMPSRTSSNIIWDEENDLLLLGKQIIKKHFHSLASVADMTRVMRVAEVVHELLIKDKHSTLRDVFYQDVEIYGEQKNSDKCIEDIASMLYTTRNATHIIASAKGLCVGRLRVRDENNIIDLEKFGSGAWAITPMLDKVDIIESDAEFILVIEKEAAMRRISEDKFWKKFPSIIITAKGAADIATRMFLKRLNKELQLPVFSLVDSDPYGHYIHSVYLRGSKRLSYESPFLATPDIKLLGVLTKDLDAYNVPKKARLEMKPMDIKRTKELLKEDFVKKNKKWEEDLQLALKLKKKAEIQALSSHGLEFLSEEYLPEKLTTGDWI
jgi:meiotic recombination protein SPO11